MQKGGETEANNVLNSFLSERHIGYIKNISRPEESRIHCSRLSPYLAWGNLSIRQVEKVKNNFYKNSPAKKRFTCVSIESCLALPLYSKT